MVKLPKSGASFTTTGGLMPTKEFTYPAKRELLEDALKEALERIQQLERAALWAVVDYEANHHHPSEAHEQLKALLPEETDNG